MHKIKAITAGWLALFLGTATLAGAYTELSGELYDGAGGPLARGTYAVTGGISVPAGRSLTIEAGAVVKFNPGRDLYVDGTLRINGAEGNPAVFTSVDDNSVGETIAESGGDPQPGHWPKIEFGPNSEGNLSHAIIRYGGRWAGGTNTHALMIFGSVSLSDVVLEQNLNSAVWLEANASLDRVTVRNTENGHGVRIAGVVEASLRDCVFEDNEHDPVFMDNPSNLITCEFQNLTAINNRRNGIAVRGGGTFERSGTVPAMPLPIVAEGDVYVGSGDPEVPDVSVTFAPGVVWKFNGRFMGVHDELHVNGAAGNPVIFTSLEDDAAFGDTNNDGDESTPGHAQWAKVEFLPGSRGNLSHTVIRCAGRWPGGTNTHALTIYSDDVSVSDTRITDHVNSAVWLEAGATFERVTVRNTEDGHGVHIAGVVEASLRDCVFEDNEHDPVYMDNPSNLITCNFQNLAVSNHRRNGLVVRHGGTFERSGTVPALPLPIVAEGDVYIGSGDPEAPDVTVTFAPGAVWKFNGRFMAVHDELHVNGTANNPVILTSLEDDTAFGDTNNDGAESAPGHAQWAKLEFLPSSRGNLSHTVIRNAGRWPGGNNTNALAIYSDDVSVSDTLVSDHVNSAVWLEAGATLDRVTVRNTEDGHGVRIAGVVEASLRDCVFENNENSAVYMDNPSNLITCAFENLRADNNGLNAITAGHWGVFERSGTVPATPLPIVAEGDVYIGSGDPEAPDVSVTFAPGVVWKFNGRVMAVNDELNVNGSAANPVILTSLKDDTVFGDTNNDGAESAPGPGQWTKLEYMPDARGFVSHAVIRFGGRWPGGNNTDMVVAAGTNLTLSDVHCRGSANSGVFLGNGEHSLERVTCSGNGANGLYLAEGGNTIVLDSVFADNGDDGIRIRDSHSLTGERLRIEANGDDGVDSETSRPVSVTQSDIVENGDWGVRMRLPTVMDFTQNFWGDPAGPLDENESVGGQNDNLALFNPGSAGDRVTDFADWGGFRMEPFHQKSPSGDFQPLIDGFRIEPVGVFTGNVPVFGNNFVLLENNEAIVIDRRTHGDVLVWLTGNGALDVAAAPAGTLIQSIVPAAHNAIGVLLQNQRDGEWSIQRLTGPVFTAVPRWNMH